MDAIFRLIDQIHSAKVGEIGQYCQGQEAERSIRGHPGRHFQAPFITEHEVAVLIVGSLKALHVDQVGQGGLQVRDPGPESLLLL
jgi:hypothetical protein